MADISVSVCGAAKCPVLFASSSSLSAFNSHEFNSGPFSSLRERRCGGCGAAVTLAVRAAPIMQRNNNDVLFGRVTIDTEGLENCSETRFCYHN